MFVLELMTPEKIVFQGSVSALIAPGKVGYFEILTDHAPMIVSLVEGEVRLVDQEKRKHVYRIEGGVLEVRQNQASLLADSVEFL